MRRRSRANAQTKNLWLCWLRSAVLKTVSITRIPIFARPYRHRCQRLISHSPRFKAVIEEIGQVAQTNTTVLLLGETGSGKEVLAQAIHDASAAADRPMIKVNCAALPATLIESELFGREKGAFTGAIARQAGRFEIADGSTIFLDEIGELPLELQPKLLRVLQEGEFELLGDAGRSRSMCVSLPRRTATSHKRLAKENFGRMFYRLDVFPIELPPYANGRKTSRCCRGPSSRNSAIRWENRSRELERFYGRTAWIIPGPAISANFAI